MTSTSKFANVSMPRKIILGSAVVLLISSFLPWYYVNFGGFGSASASGWQGLGVVAWLLVIALLAVEGCRIAGVLPLEDGRADLATMAAAGGALAFGLLFVIVRLTQGYLGFGFYLGLIALLVLAFGAFGLYRSGAAMVALKDLQASTGKKTD